MPSGFKGLTGFKLFEFDHHIVPLMLRLLNSVVNQVPMYISDGFEKQVAYAESW